MSHAFDCDKVQFVRSVSLEGHENWIRTLQWSSMDLPSADRNSQDTSPSLMLVSAAQDKLIRLWKVSYLNPNDTNSSSSLVTQMLAGQYKSTLHTISKYK